MTDADLWRARILVAAHAAERIRARLGWANCDRVPGEVRVALLEGRLSEAQPPWTDPGAGRRHRAPREGRFYAWDESFGRCWVVQRTAGALYVVTVLLDRDGRAATARRRLVRAGSVCA